VRWQVRLRVPVVSISVSFAGSGRPTTRSAVFSAMESLVEFLAHQPLLVLFLVIGTGYFLGSVSLFRFSLGPAAVLFTGIAVGAIEPRLRIPEFIPALGLILFVYTTGLQSGATFFNSFGQRAIRANLAALGILSLAAALCAAASALWNIAPALIVGVFTGSLTNTPALASSIEALRKATFGFDNVKHWLDAPVIGYGVSYPFGVIGVLLGFYIFEQLMSGQRSTADEAVEEPASDLIARSYRVTNSKAIGVPIKKLLMGSGAVLSRMKRGATLSLVDGSTVLQRGDIVTAVCENKTHEYLFALFGEASEEALESQRGEMDYRRMEVSNKDVVGRKIKELNFPGPIGATITRLRRGDVDFVPSGDTVIEHGDRVRVLTHRSNMNRVTKYFGDSIRSGSEADFFPVSLGIVLGALVGLLPVPLPGGNSFSLGFAGGPLVVGLILGRIQRTGPIIWGMPFSANLTLRQIGLVLFLAGVGSKAGDGFVRTLAEGGWRLAVIGAIVTTVSTALALTLGVKLMKLSTPEVMGFVSGIQTQPACLAYANKKTSTNAADVWYSAVYPVAMIAKIILAQLLVYLLL
jgi:putative transport protein